METVYLYVNKSRYKNRSISKIGISNDPEKRIKEFNCGVLHRCSKARVKAIKFSRFFTVKVGSRSDAKEIERGIKKQLHDKNISLFGNEVFDVTPSDICESINSGVFYA